MLPSPGNRGAGRSVARSGAAAATAAVACAARKRDGWRRAVGADLAASVICDEDLRIRKVREVRQNKQGI